VVGFGVVENEWLMPEMVDTGKRVVENGWLAGSWCRKQVVDIRKRV